MKPNKNYAMMNRRVAITRAMQATAACALTSKLSLLGAAPAAQPSAQNAQLTVGLATFGFPGLTNPDLAKDLAAAGVRTVQLFLSQKDSSFWKYNSRADVSSLTPERCRAIAEVYRGAGLSIHSIGVYTNLIHPAETERKANLAYFEAMMVVGRHMGVSTFITEAGHYQAPEPNAPVEYHLREDVWKRMVATGKELAAIAERHNATVLLEPFFRGFLASAKRTRVFLEEVGSPRLRALLDPANLLEVNDLEEMFDQLSPHIDCLHAKDRKLHVDRGVPAGQGDLDYRKFVTLAASRTPRAPLILEYVGPNDYRQALAHLRETMQAVGVRERLASVPSVP